MKRIIEDVLSDDDNYTIESAFSDFLITKESENKSPATIKSYRRNLRSFFEYLNSACITSIYDIDKAVVDDYKLYLIHRDDITDASKCSYLTHAKAFLRYLMANDTIPEFHISSFAPSAKESVSTYSDDEIRKLLACNYKHARSFTKQRAYCMMCVLLYTGMRRKSLVSLKINSIDFESKLIKVPHIKRQNVYTFRQIPLNKELEIILKSYLRKTSSVRKNNGEDYLFPNAANKPMLEDSANKIIRKLFEDCGVEFRGCHEFRRTFASTGYKILDKDLLTISRLMLLSDSRILESHYINLDSDQLQKASDQLSFDALTSNRHVMRTGQKIS